MNKKVFINCSYSQDHSYRLSSMIFLLRRLNIDVLLPDLSIKNDNALSLDIYEKLKESDASIHDFDLSVNDSRARFLVPMVYGLAKAIYLDEPNRIEPLLISTTSKDLYYDLIVDIIEEEKNYFKNETFIPKIYDLLLSHGLCSLYNVDDLYVDTVSFMKEILELENTFREHNEPLPIRNELIVKLADQYILDNHLN